MAKRFLPTFPWKVLTGTVLVTAVALSSFGFLIHSLPDSTQKVRDEQKEFVMARGRILHLDEILTMSARMAAETGDEFWVRRYNHYEIELGQLIDRAYSFALTRQVQAAIALTNEANDRLVEMERAAFDAIEAGNLTGAQNILYTDSYEEQKRIYTQGMRDLLTRVDVIFDEEVNAHKRRYMLAKVLGFFICILVLMIWVVVISMLRRWNQMNDDTQQKLVDATTFVSLAATGAGLAPWRYSNVDGKVELSALCASILGFSTEGKYTVREVLSRFGTEERGLIFGYVRRALKSDDFNGFQVECPLTFHDESRWVTCSGSVELTRDESSRTSVINIRGALHDITRRKRAEDIAHDTNQALEEGALKRLGVVERQAVELRRLALQLTEVEQKERQRLSMVLHDHLQQLLVSARFQLAMLVSPNPENLAEKVKTVDSVLDECINESRSLSVELSPPVLKDAGFLAACQWLVRRMRETHGLEIVLELEPEAEPHNDTLRILLFQALRELLLNVIKHAYVRTVNVDVLLDEAGRIELRVEDQGVGFDSTDFSDSGQQTHSGLGLFSLRERVLALGGEFSIQSVPDSGTKVKIALDRGLVSASRSIASIASISRASPLIPDTSAKGHQVRVLVVDNHLELRRGLCAFLQSQGDYVVVGEASDGYQAVELNNRLNPDLIIMDVAMPGLSGIEATKAIVHDSPTACIIGLSMHETKDMELAMLNAGAVAYFSKAQPTDQLVETLKGLFKRSAADSSRLAEAVGP